MLKKKKITETAAAVRRTRSTVVHLTVLFTYSYVFLNPVGWSPLFIVGSMDPYHFDLEVAVLKARRSRSTSMDT